MELLKVEKLSMWLLGNCIKNYFELHCLLYGYALRFFCIKHGVWIKLTFILGSSADINPIGSISKVDLRRFIAWASMKFDMPILKDFISAIPTAELEPIT